MIRRRRGAEPAELARARAWRVARGVLHRGARATDDGYGSPRVRVALRRAQAGRCAYCATRTVESHFDALDHYRPRAAYWWLTWTWQNLWLACAVCQGKSSAFPLEPGAAALSQPTVDDMHAAFALSTERPALLDPAQDMPQLHLCVEEVPGTGGGWFWSPRSERGRQTVELLHLDRWTRRSEYEALRQHLRRRLAPAVEAIAAALREGEVDVARRRWEGCRRDFLWRDVESSSEADHLVPSWWYLRAFFERHDLAEHGMVMWLYPDAGAAPGSEGVCGVSLALEPGAGMPSRLHATYIRAVKRAPRAHVSAAIMALCRERPRTPAELARDLGRAGQTVARYLRALVSAGRLERRDAGRYHAVEVAGSG